VVTPDKVKAVIELHRSMENAIRRELERLAAKDLKRQP
jgi:hypothetical protein